MVESGRIDHAHHLSNAYRALTDAQQMALAVKVAVENTDPEETLIIVSADHSHVFTIGGYPQRGNPILGLTQGVGASTPDLDLLGLPYTTLNYANGPGYTGASFADAKKTKPLQPAGSKNLNTGSNPVSGTPAVSQWASGSEGHNVVAYDEANGRPLLNNDIVRDPNYLQESIIPLNQETHAAEDVAILATGPQAHLFHGIVEQNVIYHVMAEAFGFNHHD